MKQRRIISPTPSFDALGSLVPARHPIVRIEQQNGIIFDALHEHAKSRVSLAQLFPGRFEGGLPRSGVIEAQVKGTQRGRTACAGSDRQALAMLCYEIKDFIYRHRAVKKALSRRRRPNPSKSRSLC